MGCYLKGQLLLLYILPTAATSIGRNQVYLGMRRQSISSSSSVNEPLGSALEMRGLSYHPS